MEIEPTMDVQKFLNTNPFSPFQWLIWGFCFIIVLFDGFDTAAIGYIAPSLLKEWSLTKADLAPVLNAALFGLAIGAIIAGPLSDRFGRKWVLILSTALFSLATLGSAFSGSLDILTVARFIAGLGLGAAMPNVVTLMSEYCPDNKRSILTNAMFCGFPLGASLGGFLAGAIIPVWGWRSVLIIGGIAPFIVILFGIIKLPESIRFLVLKSHFQEAIRATLMRVNPAAAIAREQKFTMTETVAAKAGSHGVGLIWSPGNILGTVSLCVTYFMGLVIFYAMINWLPTLLTDSGMTKEAASFTTALFPLGGIFAIASGWLMDRYNMNFIIGLCYAFTAICIYLIGQVLGAPSLLVIIVFMAGALMNTAQSSMAALAAAFYPTQGRATGVSWMLGIGRFGGIAGTSLVAFLTAQQASLPTIFTVLAVAGAIAAGALFVKQKAYPEQSAAVRLSTIGGE